MGSVRSRLAHIRLGLRRVAKGFLAGHSKGSALAAFWLARGGAATGIRDFNRAQNYYLRAIARSPVWAAPHVALGNMLIGAGRAPDAIPSFEAALQFEPGRRDAAYGLGMALLTDCRCDDAVAHFRRASQSDPHHQPFYLGLGAALHLSGRLRDAVSAWAAGMEVQAQLAKQAGIASDIRYLPGIFTQAIGHLAYIDIWVKRQLLGLSPTQRYIVLAPNERTANRAYLACWRDHIEVITGTEAELAQRSLFADDDLTVIWLRDKWLWLLEGACHIQALWEKERGGSLLSLSDENRRRARFALETLGLPRDVWFVTLHVRDSGYYQAGKTLDSRRSAAIADYLPAIETITRAGGWVVRIGDPSCAKLPALPGVIDYAHGPRQDWLDVYLLAAPRFLIGTNSGPSWAAGTFGVPALLTNWAPMGIQSYFSNTVMLPQLLKTRAGRLLSIKDQLEEPVAWTDSRRRLLQLGLEAVPNTPEEIASSVEEMLARTRGGWSENRDDVLQRHRFLALLGSMGISGRGSLSRQFMQNHASQLD